MDPNSFNSFLELERKKVQEKVIKYNKFIEEVKSITNYNDLMKFKSKYNKLSDSKEEFYETIKYLISIDLEFTNIYLLYKEYNLVYLLDADLQKEIFDRELELDNNYDNYLTDKKLVDGYNTESNKLDNLIEDIVAFEKITTSNLEDLFKDGSKSKLNNKNLEKILLLTSFFAFKNNSNILGTLMISYLLSKNIKGVLKKENIDISFLYKKYISSLEGCIDNIDLLTTQIESNVKDIAALEQNLKVKYEKYLKDEKFVMLFELIKNIRNTLNKELDKSKVIKNNIISTIDKSKIKIKAIES